MKIRFRSLIYVQDTIGALVAFTNILWSVRGMRYDRSFLCTFWLSFASLIDFIVKISNGLKQQLILIMEIDELTWKLDVRWTVTQQYGLFEVSLQLHVFDDKGFS